jgi:epsilon-lactone hydrolase
VIPSAISPEARAVLAAMAEAPSPVAPSADDPEGWRAFIESMREAVRSGLAANVGAEPIAGEVDRSSGVPVHIVENGSSGPVLLNVHGGGFVLGGGEACRLMGVSVARGTGLTTYSVDYRLAPEHPYPAALDDCLIVYRWLLERYGAESVVVGGHSAGAALVASLVHRARDEGLPVPRAALLLSPEADLTEEGDSFDSLGRVDFLTAFVAMYADGADLASPYLSPLAGDLSGFPPTFLQAGTRDLFLSNTVRMHRALRRAGVRADLHVWEAMPHAGFSGTAPEDAEVYEEVRAFLGTLA